MKTTATRAPVSTVEFVSPKDLHMSATVLSTGLELTVKVRFHIRYKISIHNGVNPTFCPVQETHLLSPRESNKVIYNHGKNVLTRNHMELNLSKWSAFDINFAGDSLAQAQNILCVTVQQTTCNV